MKLRLLIITIFITTPLISFSREKPWEEISIKALKAMNSGNGKEFILYTHREFKVKMKNFMLNDIKIKNNEKLIVKHFSVSTMKELEELELDRFVEILVHNMHFSSPERKRKLLRTAKTQVLHSIQKKDTAKIVIEVSLPDSNKVKKGHITVYSKFDGEKWLYNGN